jgi:hypothetical protein
MVHDLPEVMRKDQAENRFCEQEDHATQRKCIGYKKAGDNLNDSIEQPPAYLQGPVYALFSHKDSFSEIA